MSTPHEVIVFTVEDVLLDIYDGDLSNVETDEATKAFGEWLHQQNAHYYSVPIYNSDVVVRAVLDTIKAGKRIVVIAQTSP